LYCNPPFPGQLLRWRSFWQTWLSGIPFLSNDTVNYSFVPVIDKAVPIRIPSNTRFNVFQLLRFGFVFMNLFIGSLLVVTTFSSYTLRITVTVAHVTSHPSLLTFLLATLLFPWGFGTQMGSIPSQSQR
jgi:hypothetical protein